MPIEMIKVNMAGQTIKEVRRKKGLSQERLAKQASIDRTTIARLESGRFKTLSLKHLEAVATALEIDFKALFKSKRPSGVPLQQRSPVNHVEFTIEYPQEGLRILSFLPRHKDFFIGKMEIKPQRTVRSNLLPHALQVCLHMLEGKLLFSRADLKYMLKSGDCFAFAGDLEYECHNPEILKTSACLVMTYPAFLSVEA
jgi:transcriptional regulator with XRE-family HTH domain